MTSCRHLNSPPPNTDQNVFKVVHFQVLKSAKSHSNRNSINHYITFFHLKKNSKVIQKCGYFPNPVKSCLQFSSYIVWSNISKTDFPKLFFFFFNVSVGKTISPQ